MNKLAVFVSGLVLSGALIAEAGCGACGHGEGAKRHKHGVGAKAEGCAGGVCAKWGAGKMVEAKHETPTIGTEALEALLGSKVPVVVLDARTGKWDDGRRIPGAGNLHAGSSKEEIAEAIPSKDALVVTYCTNVKCQASPKLAKRLKSLGYSNVIEYPQGIDGWEAAGKTVNQLAKK